MPARTARYPALLLGLFCVWFVVLGVSPVSRPTWLLENLSRYPYPSRHPLPSLKLNS